MSSTKQEENKKKRDYSGKPCSEKELKESEKCWQDMNDCFAKLNKKKK